MWFWKRKNKAKSQQPAQRSDVREFIRHTVDVPIEYSRLDGDADTGLPDFPADTARGGPVVRGEAHDAHGVNVGFGGLAFTTNECPSKGDMIELRIPTVEPPFVARARVAWCRPEDGHWLVGASFLDASDAFRSRMVQQVCSIENYRKEVRETEGRDLTPEEASTEWITKFANRFPTAGESPSTSRP